MVERRRYRKRAARRVTAVRLDLDTDGFDYRKWGGIQRCKAGDWIVENGGETHTIDAGVFARTYRQVSPGVYAKVTPVWAEVAGEAGSVKTREGVTHYEAGDYIVWNDEAGDDVFAVTAERFEAMYELDE